ncbi:MAG: HD domain-containing protein [Candidatus Nanopelagicales bacterium]|nr:HD domain-containing protein [Candidatus Nanopelagicales bacterium]
MSMSSDGSVDLHAFDFPDDTTSRAAKRVPLKLVAVFVLVSLVWIFASDQVVDAIFTDAAARTTAQSLKGIAYVVVTSAVLFLALRFYVIKLNAEHAALEDAWDETILGWALAMDARESQLASHSQRVADLTLRLAQHAGIPTTELRTIYRGALLHDVGKLGVPESVLSHPGRLDDAQWALIKQHPENAMRMLAPISFLHDALDIPHCHHEQWDGSGYPRGLSGDAIPYAARLFAVVDVYDAVTAFRPYHASRTHDEAMAIIRSESGTHFDPAIVTLFSEMMGLRETLAPVAHWR